MRKLAKTLAVIMSGATMSSLLLTDSDRWKFYLPVCLLAIAYLLYTQPEK